ncbi:MAG: hypothetical protein Q9170_006016 [Blastenia crenularia]
MDERSGSLGLASLVHALYVHRAFITTTRSFTYTNSSRYSIENPLSHLTPDQLQKDARSFARREGLGQYEDLIERGARIAKDPQYFEHIPGLTEEEKQAIWDEKRHRFRQPSALYLTIIVCSIGAAVQ